MITVPSRGGSKVRVLDSWGCNLRDPVWIHSEDVMTLRWARASGQNDFETYMTSPHPAFTSEALKHARRIEGGIPVPPVPRG